METRAVVDVMWVCSSTTTYTFSLVLVHGGSDIPNGKFVIDAEVKSKVKNKVGS